jgi:hypothetical protein
MEDEEGTIIFLDQQKAFDRAECDPKLFLHHKSLYPLDLIFFPNYVINMRPNHCPILLRFNLEKKKGKEKLWNRVKTNDGKYKEDIVSILEEQVNFFEKLFTSEG